MSCKQLFFYIVIVFSISLISCKNTSRQKQAVYVPMDTVSGNSVSGLWSINIWCGNPTEPDRMKARLNIKENGTFYFEEEHRYGIGISEGTWSQTGNFILLTSDVRYLKKVREMEKTGDFPRYYRYTPNDTFPVYFPGKRFVIRNDTMCSLKGMDIQYPLMLVKNIPRYIRFDNSSYGRFVNFIY